MSWTINQPKAENVGDSYTCAIDPPSPYFESRGPVVDTTTSPPTMTFYFESGGSGTPYTWNLGVAKVDENENDAWEFIIMTSDDRGRTWKTAHRKKPVMMATSGGGGTSSAAGDSGRSIYIRTYDDFIVKLEKGLFTMPAVKPPKTPWWFEKIKK